MLRKYLKRKDGILGIESAARSKALFPQVPSHAIMFHDVIIRYGYKIALFGVRITWCADACNEGDLAGEIRNTRFLCP